MTTTPLPMGACSDLDRRLRRLVWIVALLAAVAAGIMVADKASDDRSAFIRWRPQVIQFWRGVNIYDTMSFPNPPILPILLYPLMMLPPLQGALAWYVLKVILTAFSVGFCFRMVRVDDRPLPAWIQAAVLLLTLRPILGDLQHGNNNLVILFLVTTCLYAWQKGHDILAGVTLALAISFKLTPALFVLYFLYKRSWRTLFATVVGLGLFLVVVPSLIIGPQFNAICLASWWERMLSPYVEKGIVTQQEVNQSLVGVLSRLLTQSPIGDGQYDVHIAAWSPESMSFLIKTVSLGLIACLAWICRGRTARRNDPRLLGEFSLVVLTMLFLSERSWKHHYVTLLLPYTYLVYRVGSDRLSTIVRVSLSAAVVLSAALMAATSSEVGGWFADQQGHKIAQGYGFFLWAGVVLYLAVAWLVRSEARGLLIEDRSVAEAPIRSRSISTPFGQTRSNVVPG